MKKGIGLIIIMCLVISSFTGCSNKTDTNNAAKQENNSLATATDSTEPTILVAAASSLKNCMDDKLIPMFQKKYKNIKVDVTYDSSGKLQTQIEEGADVDVYISASKKQMDALNDKGLIADDTIVNLLENKIVLIVPTTSDKGIHTFKDITKAEKIAIGDPESVPAGQYAKEVFDNLKIWDKVSAKASLGTNVTEVLNWVAEGSADAGVVYSTDAANKTQVKVVTEAPEGSVSKVIYPVGIVKASTKKDQAKLFTEFLSYDEAIKVFESYGFTAVK